MSLLKRAEAFLAAKAVQRGTAVSPLPGEALSDLIVTYEERLAMVLEGGDIAEAEAHRIATAECGASIAELRAELSASVPHHEVFAFISNPTARPA